MTTAELMFLCSHPLKMLSRKFRPLHGNTQLKMQLTALHSLAEGAAEADAGRSAQAVKGAALLFAVMASGLKPQQAADLLVRGGCSTVQDLNSRASAAELAGTAASGGDVGRRSAIVAAVNSMLDNAAASAAVMPHDGTGAIAADADAAGGPAGATAAAATGAAQLDIGGRSLSGNDSCPVTGVQVFDLFLQLVGVEEDEEEEAVAKVVEDSSRLDPIDEAQLVYTRQTYMFGRQTQDGLA
jgi:hypothetical protein